MEVLRFHNTLSKLEDLAAREGPNTNVFEPKIKARDQLIDLCNDLKETYERARSLCQGKQNVFEETESEWVRAQQQLCRARSLLSRTHCELEEYDAALNQLQLAHALLELSEHDARNEKEQEEDVTLFTRGQDFRSFITRRQRHLIREDRRYEGCVAFMSLYNATGVYLSMMSASEARHALSLAEQLYTEWDAWFMRQPEGCSIIDVPIDCHGKVQLDTKEFRATAHTCGVGESEHHHHHPSLLSACLTRFEMDKAFTSTLFFLAQACTSLSDTESASIYCHRTLYNQLLCRQEYDKKRWATNALQISEYYCSVHAYGKALHCLMAGRNMMTKLTTPSIDGDCVAKDEETTGLVARNYGRYYLHYLTYYAKEGRQRQQLKQQQQQQQNEKEKEKEQQQQPSSLLATGTDANITSCAPHSATETSTTDSAVGTSCWWKDFPETDAMREQPAIVTVHDAREVFKSGLKWLKLALTYHAFENSCTQHIHITQDMSNLHGVLCFYERKRSRILALKQRQIDLLKRFPDQLSFNAYPTLIRQLLYDISSLHEDLIVLRHEQMTHPLDDEKPLTLSEFNSLVRSTAALYERFCDTWRSPSTHSIPDELSEPEERLPFFRVLLRLVLVTMRFMGSTPQESLDNLDRLTALTRRAIAFGERNTFSKEERAEVEKGMSDCRELAARIPHNQYMLRYVSRQ